MYQKPNKHGVYEDAEYVIPIKIGKDAVAKIDLCQCQDGWLFGSSYNSKGAGFANPIMRHNTISDSWQDAVKRAASGIHAQFIGEKEEKLARSQITELVNSLPVLRIEDFKITQEAKKPMAKKKPETTPAANAATESAAADKIYLHAHFLGSSTPMILQKPLTEHGKKMLWDEMDNGTVFEIIDEAQFNILRNDQALNVGKPTDEKHAEVCKLADYEPMVKKTIACSEYFDHQFSSDEIKQMAAEFSQSTGRKSDLEEELKSHAQYLKSQITEVTATINRISQELGRGKRSENVKCHWIFNEPSRGQKSLYRLDTEPKELVRIAAMTASDKQMTLDDIAATKQKTERTLEEKPITAITNQPYEGEMMTDAEVKEEIGVVATSETDTETDSEAEASAEASDECPI